MRRVPTDMLLANDRRLHKVLIGVERIAMRLHKRQGRFKNSEALTWGKLLPYVVEAALLVQMNLWDPYYKSSKDGREADLRYELCFEGVCAGAALLFVALFRQSAALHGMAEDDCSMFTTQQAIPYSWYQRMWRRPHGNGLSPETGSPTQEVSGVA